MIIAAAILLTAGVLALVLFVRSSDLPEPPPANPAEHLEERKAVIYENLRDLNFEYRLGKLSDADYQKSKTGLQSELATVLAGIEKLGKAEAAPAAPAAPAKPDPLRCPKCGARFDKPMKFCGECASPMPEVKA